MSDLIVLMQLIIALATGLRAFFALYFALVILVVVLCFLADTIRDRSLHSGSEKELAVRIKSTSLTQPHYPTNTHIRDSAAHLPYHVQHCSCTETRPYLVYRASWEEGMVGCSSLRI